MADFGYFLSCEEHSPAELVEQARMAEQAGFDSLWISDHYHPWIDVSAFGPQAAEVAARIGDGLITMTPDASVVERFRRGGGGTNPVYGGLKVCWGTGEREAVRTAHRLWADEQLPGELPQVLPTPRHFERASQLVTEEQVAASVPCGDDPDAPARALSEFVEAGFDTVYVNQIGKDQQGFFDFYRAKVLPALRG